MSRHKKDHEAMPAEKVKELAKEQAQKDKKG